jgi:hypothetical protein
MSEAPAPRPRLLRKTGLVALSFIGFADARISAQTPRSLASDRARTAEAAGDTTATARKNSPSRDGWRASVGPSELLAVWNSAIPFSANDGPLWAGRGLNVSVTSGIAATYLGSPFVIRVVLAPTFTYSQNRPFDIEPGREPGRSTFSSPWHLGTSSADLPLRFGNESFHRLDPGQSSLLVANGPIEFGVSNASEWWGPGIQAALVMSDNAPGIPRLLARTARPYETSVGWIDAEFIAGTLTKSLYFDTLSTSDYRGVSGFRISLKPHGIPTLSFGIARIVYVPITDATDFLGQSLRAFTYWRPTKAVSDTLPDGTSSQRADQISAVFARWVFPASGFELFGEWARMALPRSLGELITTAGETRAYTLGLQWIIPTPRRETRVRLQSELTDLEQTSYDASRPPPDFYTGRATVQGYTQRGQVIGAAIGPGSSSQWFAGDVLFPTSQVGLFAGRIRWENDALYRQTGANFFRHDVSVYGGLRGAARLSATDVATQLTLTHRFSYLFQNGRASPGGFRTVDINNLTLAVRVTPPR